MNETEHKERTIQRIRLVYELYEKTFPITIEEAEAFDSIFNNSLIVEELEKIKARLNHRANEHLDGDYYVRIKDINEVFDEELAELKGEQE